MLLFMVTFSVAVRRATQKKISYAEIEAKLSTILAEAARAPGGPLHKVRAFPLFSQFISY